MTLIATISDGHDVFCLSDALVTRGAGSGGLIDVIPGLWGEKPLPDTHVSNLRRKTEHLSPSALVMWAGDKRVAQDLVLSLQEFYHNNNSPNLVLVRGILDNFTGRDVAAQVVSLIPDGPSIIQQTKCTQTKVRSLTVVGAGTGLNAFLDEIENDEFFEMFLAAANPSYKALLLDHHFTKAVVLGAREQVSDKWGGAVEVYYSARGLMPQNWFLRSEDILHSFSPVRLHENTWEVIAHGYVITKRYHERLTGSFPINSDLVIAEFERCLDIDKADYHYIPGINVSNKQRLQRPNFDFGALSDPNIIDSFVGFFGEGFGSPAMFLPKLEALGGVNIMGAGVANRVIDVTDEARELVEERFRVLAAAQKVGVKSVKVI